MSGWYFIGVVVAIVLLNLTITSFIQWYDRREELICPVTYLLAYSALMVSLATNSC